MNDRPVYLTNAFSLNMLAKLNALVAVQEIGIGEARKMISEAHKNGKLTNAIGHPNTDLLARKVLELDIPAGERKTVRVHNDEYVVVCQYIGPRLEEGATELPENATLKWIRVYVS